MIRKSKSYVIVSFEEHEVVCFSIDSTRPDEYVDNLERELRRCTYEGEVLLDLLAANGNGRNRFMKCDFDGTNLHWLDAKIATAKNLKSDVFKFCQQFYAEHPNFLINSVLTPAARHRFLSSVAQDSSAEAISNL